jgi:hypothetical protein
VGDTFAVQCLGVEEGPYSVLMLRDRVRDGLVHPHTRTRKSSGGEWFPLFEVPGVFSSKDWGAAVVLSFLVGMLGIDRFYLGHNGLGLLKLATLGGFGLWWIVDLVLIVMGRVADRERRALRRWA